jgi:triosephosphate isomerase
MEIKPPIIAINFKAYPTSYGERAFQIAKWAEEVSNELGNITIILIPPFTEIKKLADSVILPVFAQHADAVNLGANTGCIPPELIKEAGAVGFMINHSERKIRLSDINVAIVKAGKLGLKVLACADTPEVAAAISVLKPDIIAVEPPELIGTGIAVSKAKPEIITGTVSKVRTLNKEVIILTGAGITKPEDVGAAIKLGTAGVLVASAIMKAKDPKKIIYGMAETAIQEYEKQKQ